MVDRCTVYSIGLSTWVSNKCGAQKDTIVGRRRGGWELEVATVSSRGCPNDPGPVRHRGQSCRPQHGVKLHINVHRVREPVDIKSQRSRTDAAC